MTYLSVPVFRVVIDDLREGTLGTQKYILMSV